MTNITKLTFAVILGATLAGCGGASFEEDLLDKAEGYDAIDARVSGMTRSGPNVVNSASGTAKFSGYGSVIAGSEYNATVLVGDANVDVNFNGNTSVTGSIRNLAGVADANLYISGSGNLDSYTGQVNLSNGSVGNGNQISVDYAGTLRGNGDTLVVGGTMDGEFRGNPRIRALDISDVDLGTLNGSNTYIGVDVIAERD